MKTISKPYHNYLLTEFSCSYPFIAFKFWPINIFTQNNGISGSSNVSKKLIKRQEMQNLFASFYVARNVLVDTVDNSAWSG